MVSTRCLCFAVCLALASSCGPTRGGEAVADDSSSTAHALGGTRLRLMAGNLTTGQKTNNQSYNLGEGIRIFGGTHADVAMVQELNYFSSSDVELRSFVDQAFGPGFSFVRGAQSGIPNGVVSRYPIISQGDWVDPYVGNRAFTWAQIDVPGPRDLWVVSVHFLTANSVMRQLEAAALVASAQAQVPASDYLAIGGDFNTGSRGEPALTTLSQLVTTTGPYPADAIGNSNTSSSRNKPYDWVLVSPNLHARARPTVIGASSFASGLVVDTRSYTPLAELAPALETDSGALSMQHMGVVRDFELDEGGDVPPSVSVLSPTSGEVLWAGAPQTIRWAAVSVPRVDLSYSPDGVTFSAIANDLDATAGAYAWVLPARAARAARLRVAASGNSATRGEVAFSVAVPLHLEAPNGGETFISGSTQTIRWVAGPGLATVDLAFSSDGATFTTLASGVDAALGEWAWVTPMVASTSAVVRVTAADGSGVSDSSDGPFSLVLPKRLRIESPNGGEVLTGGQAVTIRWSATGVDLVMIGYALNGVDFAMVSPTPIDARLGELTWVPPLSPTATARVRVSDATDSSVSDSSDLAFTVSVPVTMSGVVLNEILANEPQSDITREFIELVNVTTSAVDLSGYTLSDAATVRHRFAAGTMLAAGARLVVFGGAASTGTLGLSNSGDTVSLATAAGVLVDSFTYPSSLAAVDGVSMNRSPDRSAGAAFVLHTKLWRSSLSSPGFAPDGSP